MSLENGILEVVRKSLPESTAGELKNYINEAEQAKKLLAAAKEQLDSANKTAALANDKIKSLESQVKSQWVIEDKVKETDKKLAELEKRERDLNLSLASNEIQVLRDRNNDFMRLMEIVFRNPKTVTNQNTMDNHYTNYENGQQVTRKTGENKTITTEITKD